MKYCLSKCAKRKLSAGKKALIEFVTIVSFTVGIVAAFCILIVLVGLITQGIYVYFNGNLIGLFHDVPLTGLFVFMTLFVLAVILLVSYTVLFGIYKGIKTMVTNRMVSEDYWEEDCKIFVECEEADNE